MYMHAMLGMRLKATAGVWGSSGAAGAHAAWATGRSAERKTAASRREGMGAPGAPAARADTDTAVSRMTWQVP